VVELICVHPTHTVPVACIYFWVGVVGKTSDLGGDYFELVSRELPFSQPWDLVLIVDVDTFVVDFVAVDTLAGRGVVVRTSVGGMVVVDTSAGQLAAEKRVPVAPQQMQHTYRRLVL